MVTFPLCKVNLGLYVVSRRPDGMHNLSTVFLPVGLCDTLDMRPLDATYTADILHLTGISLPGGAGADNLVLRTLAALRADHPALPYMEVWLHKRIPTGAGLGGGSSDAAFALRMACQLGNIRMTDAEAVSRLASLGADCAFFWNATPAYAEGIGEQLQPISLPQLKGLQLALIMPPVAISTREAFAGITPKEPALPLLEALSLPVGEWQGRVGNDFEATVFPLHPELAAIKQTLYDMGALYAQMSGSGSTLFALFNRPVGEELTKLLPQCAIHTGYASYRPAMC